MPSKARRTAAEDAAITAARITATKASKSAVLVASIGLLGTLSTGAVTLASHADDKPQPTNRCSISAADTVAAIDAYNKMRLEGRITIAQSEVLKADAIADQTTDITAFPCK